MKKIKLIGIWMAALLITVGAAIFQRMTGPTHPFRNQVTLNDQSIQIKLLRSADTGQDAQIVLPITDTQITGIVDYRLFPSSEAFTSDTIFHTHEGMVFYLPEQKAAGKIEYKIRLADTHSTYESPLLRLRYKDPVPVIWLVPHILIMFLAMLFAVASALLAAYKVPSFSRVFLWSGIFLFVGGMVLGPIVQKYAFGEFWTGIPFGWDLTDNKTLLTMLVFIAAMIKNYWKPSRVWTIIAVIVLLAAYSIPHSMFGSELNHSTGKVVQG